jgi:hypothetical protein
VDRGVLDAVGLRAEVSIEVQVSADPKPTVVQRHAFAVGHRRVACPQDSIDPRVQEDKRAVPVGGEDGQQRVRDRREQGGGRLCPAP